MNDVRRLLAIKANIETAMQRDLAPHIRVFAQQQLGEVCKAIEEAREEWDKLFEQQEIDQLKQRVAELEASNKELLDALEDLIYECGQAKECGLIDWKVMGTAREVAHKMRGIQQ